MPFKIDPSTGREVEVDAMGNPIVGMPPPAPGLPTPQAPAPPQAVPPRFSPPPSQSIALPEPPSLGPAPPVSLPEPSRPMPGLPEPPAVSGSAVPPPFQPVTTETDAYARAVSTPPKTSLLQRLGAMALGGAAGYANAGGRVRIDPRSIDSATQNILYPGRAADLARRRTAMEIEQQKNASNRQAQLDTANVGLTRARTDSENAQVDLYKAQAQKALNQPRRYQARADGSVFDMETGTFIQVPQSVGQQNAIRAKEAATYGLTQGTPEFTEYVLTGKISKPGKEGKLSLQERLSALYAIPNRTPDQDRELKSIEKAMTLVANTYGAGYKMLSTPEGQPFLFHPHQGAVASPAGSRPPYSAGERQDVAALSGMVEDVALLRVLAEEKKSKIGPIAGRVADFDRKFLGADASTNDLFRISDNLADQLLRVRSGAQINEQEYARLRLLTPNPRYSASKFFSDLTGFESELKRLLAKRSGAAPLTSAQPTQPSSSASSANPLGSASKPGDRTPDGGIIRSVKTRNK